MADQQVKVVALENGQYKVGLPRTAIARVDVVDVDFVMTTKSGERLILPGAAIESTGEHPPAVTFSDGQVSSATMFSDVGKVLTPETSIPVMASLTEHELKKSEGQKNTQRDGKEGTHAEQGQQQDQDVNRDEAPLNPNLAPLAMPAQSSVEQLLAAATKGLNEVAAKVGNYDLPPNPLQAPPSAAAAAASTVPPAYPVPPTIDLWMGNVTGVTASGTSVDGSGGASGSSASAKLDPSSSLQKAAEVIDQSGNASAQVIYGDGAFTSGHFQKEFLSEIRGTFVSLSGLTISGLSGTNITVAGLSADASGNYVVPVSNGNQFSFALDYTLGHPTSPITLTLTETITRSTGQIAISKILVIQEMDVTGSTNLSLTDSAGNTIYVLPSNGISNVISAGPVDSTIYGGYASDTIVGNHAGAYTTTMYGGPGSDTFIAGAGASDFEGGGDGTVLPAADASGVNIVSFANSSGATIDLTNTVLGNTLLGGGAGSVGGDGAGSVYHNIQSVVGSAGSDTFIGGTAAGSATMVGGGGSDWIDYQYAATAATVNMATMSLNSGSAANDRFSGIDNVIGSNHGDYLVGGSTANSFLGGTGNDTLVGGTSGHDYLSGGGGNDTLVGGAGGHNAMLGGAGDDLLIGSTGGSDSFDGGAGSNSASFANATQGLVIDLTGGALGTHEAAGDTFANIQTYVGSAYDDTFVGQASGSLITMNGGGGNDWVSYSNSGVATTVNLADNTANSGAALNNRYANIENVIGSSSNDVLIGDAHDNTLLGGAGNDTLIGGAGADYMDGGGGADVVSYATPVTIDMATNGFAGSTVYSGTFAGGDAQGDTYVRIQTVVGSAGDDTFIGGVGSTVVPIMDGGGGADWIDYSQSNIQSSLTVNLGYLAGEATAYRNSGAAYNDRISNIENIKGGNFGGLLIGDHYSNTILGGTADDTLIGGGGADWLDGGGGTNTASFATSTSGVMIDVSNAVLGNTLIGGGAGTITGDGAGDVYRNIATVVGSSHDDTFIGGTGAGSPVMYGGGSGAGAGNDWIDYEYSAVAATLDLSGTVANGGAAANDSLQLVENIRGSNHGDTLYGDGFANSIVAGSGNNYVSAGAGNDVITVVAGTGTNTFYGDAGNDLIYGGGGTDRLYGGANNDTLVAGSGQETLNGGAGADTLVGTGNANAVADYSDDATAHTITLGTLASQVGGDAQGDVLVNIENVLGGTGNDLITGDANVSTLWGNGGSDVLYGKGGNDVLYGGASGVATLVGGAGSDTMIGQGGTAIASYADSASGVTIDLATGAHAGSTFTSGLYASGGDAAGDVYVNIGSVTGSAGIDDFIGGTSNAPTMVGSGGIDWIDYSGTNILSSVTVNLASGTGIWASGTDHLSGIENIKGSGSDDTLTGDSTANSIQGGAGNDTIDGGGGGDRLDGGNGAGETNTLSFASALDNVTVYLGGTDQNGAASLGAPASGYTGVDKIGTLTLDSFKNFQDVVGSTHNDLLVGDSNVNTLWGNGGSDTLYGKGGNDVLYGGASGVATLIGGAGSDTMIGQGGTAIASYADSASGVTIDLATGTHGGSTFTSGLYASGGDAAGDVYVNIDSVTGSSSSDDFIGGTSNAPTMVGSGSIDWIDYTGTNIASAVTVNLASGTGVWASGTDHLSGIENIKGSAYADTLTGDSSANSIQGGAGNDTIDGGGGGDRLDGGNGVGETNTLSFASASDNVTVYLGGTDQTGAASLGAPASGYTGVDKIGTLTLDSFKNFQDVVGSTHNDLLVGDANVNTLWGNGGSDTLYGKGGNDVLYGGTSGVATLDGGAGSDTMIGQGGTAIASYADSASGVTIDLATGAHGGGTVTAGLHSAGGDAEGDVYTNVSTVSGSAGSDVFVGGTSSDAGVMDGGGGADWIDYSFSNISSSVTVNLTSGTGVWASGTDHLSRIENIKGSGSDDTLIGDNSANSILGGAGNDTLNGKGGNDTLDGGAGLNTVSYAGEASPVTVDLANNTAIGASSGTDTLVNIQNVIGSGGDDLFYANSAANTFTGNGGNDIVSYARSTAGLVIDETGSGNATGYAAGDVYLNIATVVGSNYNDTFVGGTSAGAPAMAGGGGADWLSYGYGNIASSVTVNLASHYGTGAFGTDYVTGIENVVGSAYNDVLTGDSSANSILAGAGNDTVDGGGGGDILDGGTGSGQVNTLSFASASGNVTAYLGGTDQTGAASLGAPAAGYTGVDKIGTLTLDSFKNFQNITGSTYRDLLVGDSNANVITDSGAGATLYGMGGNDTITYSGSASATLYGGAGNDALYGSGGTTTLDGGAGSDTLVGSGVVNIASYADSASGLTIDLSSGIHSGTTIYSGTYASGDAVGDIYVNIGSVVGSTGNDTFVGNTQSSAITMVGGGGTDWLTYTYAASGVTVNLGNNALNGGLAANDRMSGIENIVGSAYADTLTGDGLANSFVGNGGIDTVSYVGDAANLTLNLTTNVNSGGTAAGDTYTGITNLTGGSGNDLITGDGNANTLSGGGGTDTLYGMGGDDTFIGGLGHDTFYGGTGTNWLSYASATGGATVDLSNGANNGGVAQYDRPMQIGGTDTVENLIGSSFGDKFTGDAAANIFSVVHASGSGGDTIDGGAGIDTVTYANQSGHPGLTIYLGGLNTSDVSIAGGISGYAGFGQGGAAGDYYTNVENVIGGTANDTIVGSDADNTISGGGGTDYLYGLQGNDTFIVGTGATRVDGGAGTDLVTYASVGNAMSIYLGSTNQNGVSWGTTLSGFAGEAVWGSTTDYLNSIESIIGGTAADLVVGDANANTVSGGGGNDTLYGKAGADVLYGSAGAGVVTTLVGGAGGDTMVGGASATAIASYADNTTGMVIDLAQVPSSGTLTAGTHATSDASGDVYVNIASVVGSSGNETFIGGTAAASPSMIGGGGTDWIDYHYVTGATAVTVNLATGTNSGAAANDHLSGVGNIVGSTIAAGDNFTGDANANIFAIMHSSASGSDTINGGGGNDTVTYANQVGSPAVSVYLAGLDQAGAAVSGTIVGYAGIAKSGSQSDYFSSIENVTGGLAADLIVGDANANTLTGGGGNDTLYGKGGSDILYGSAGAGVVTTLVGGAGGDTMVGGAGATAIASYADAASGMVIDIAGSHDTGDAVGDVFNNIASVVGSTGNDTFVGGTASGSPTMVGGGGNDWLDYRYVTGASAVTVDLTTGTGGVGAAQNDHFSGVQNIYGSTIAAGDSLIGNANANIFAIMHSSSQGSDTITGGGGADLVTYASQSGNPAVSIYLGGVDQTGAAVAGTLAGYLGVGKSGTQYDHFTGIENATGGTGADLIVGDSAANTLTGGGGADTIYGGGGNDVLNASAGAVTTLVGGAGADTLLGAGSGTVIASYADNTTGMVIDLAGTWSGGTLTAGSYATGDASGDRYYSIASVVGSTGNETFIGGTASGSPTMIGGGGTDWLDYSHYAGASGATVDLTNSANDSGAALYDRFSGIENFVGTANADTFILDANANLIHGGGGIDTVSYASSVLGVEVYLGGTDLSGGTTILLSGYTGYGSGAGYSAGDYYQGISNVIGSANADTLVGDSGHNTILGGAGNDTIYGGGGGDTMDGGLGNDLLTYRADSSGVSVYLGGYDQTSHNLSTTIAGYSGVAYVSADGTTDHFTNFENVTGGSGNDLLVGDVNANTLDGGGGSNTLYGMGGNDVLNAGKGVATLDGGAGTDTVDYLSYDNGSITADLDAGKVTQSYGTDTLLNDEIIRGTNSGDIFSGTGSSLAATTLFGMGGSDTFNLSATALASVASIDGGAGSDSLISSGGDLASIIAKVTNMEMVDLHGNGAGDSYTLGGGNVASILGGSTATTLSLVIDSGDTLNLTGAGTYTNDGTVGQTTNYTFYTDTHQTQILAHLAATAV